MLVVKRPVVRPASINGCKNFRFKGNPLTEDDQWRKIDLMLDVAHEVLPSPRACRGAATQRR
jgi:hypothetical protein